MVSTPVLVIERVCSVVLSTRAESVETSGAVLTPTRTTAKLYSSVWNPEPQESTAANWYRTIVPFGWEGMVPSYSFGWPVGVSVSTVSVSSIQ